MLPPLLRRLSGALLLPLALVACNATRRAPEPEAVSLLGRPLFAPAPTGEARERLEQDLAEALARWEQQPDEEAAIWVGRRLGYLGRYREAQAWFGARLEEFPHSYRLLRHRGHRWITLRAFDRAHADLERAWDLARLHPDRVEPDGAPNTHGVPVSTDHTNILYHWALAAYLRGDFVLAAEVARRCAERSPNADMWVAATYWRFHALWRGGDAQGARRVAREVPSDLPLLENDGYKELLWLASGRGYLATRSRSGGAGVVGATLAYGRAIARLERTGDVTRATADLARIVQDGPWNAFGVIAAEADLARWTSPAAGGPADTTGAR